MTIVRIAALYSMLAIAVLGVGGCANQQVPAEEALAGIEKTLEGSGEQVRKYLPEQYDQIVARVDGLRSSLQAGEFGDVVKQAPAVADELRRAVADSAIKRAEERIAIEAEWKELSSSIPAMIAATDQHITKLAGRPPQGMEREAFRLAVARYEEARAAWGQVATAIETKNFEQSVTTARGLKATLAETAAALGAPAT